MAQTYHCKEETTGPQTSQLILAYWTKIKIIVSKQTSRLQSNFETNLDLWSSTLEICLNLQFGNPGEIPVESVADHNGCTVVCAEYSDKK
jgi:hypothetical protein